MRRGRTDKAAIKPPEHHMHIVVGVSLFVLSVALAVALNALLPPEYRACALMPGFCSQKHEEVSAAPFEEIGKLRPDGAKFDLSSHLSTRY